MRKKKSIICIVLIFISIFLLSGCGDSSTVKKIRESIEKNDAFTAKQIYEDASKDLSKERKKELNNSVSKELVAYLKNERKDLKEEDIKNDNSKVASFYNTLDGIEQIGINDKNLEKKIDFYKQEIEQVEETSATKQEVSKETEPEAISTEEKKLEEGYVEFINNSDEVDKKAIEMTGKLIADLKGNIYLFQDKEWKKKFELVGLLYGKLLIDNTGIVASKNLPKKYWSEHISLIQGYQGLTKSIGKVRNASDTGNLDLFTEGLEGMSSSMEKIDEIRKKIKEISNQ